jgi:hypothetical protein
MKKAIQHAPKLPFIYGLITLAFLIFIFSFRRPGSPENGNAPTSGPGPGPGNQPIATQVTVQQLAAPTALGNVLLTATFDEATVKRFMTNRTLSISLEQFTGKRLVLNDQGIDGDEKPGDNVYSIILQEEPTAVTSDLSSFNGTMSMVSVFTNNNMLLDPTALDPAVITTNPNLQTSSTILPTEVISFEGRDGEVVSGASVAVESDAFNAGATSVLTASTFFSIAPAVALDSLLRDRVLMITDLGVTQDPSRTNNPCCACNCSNGKWTFGYLMSQMANQPVTSITTLQMIQSWLDHWLTAQVVNGDNAPARTQLFNKVIAPWVRRSNPGAVVTLTNWKTFNLNLCFAPFRLLAINPRFDLRGNPGYGGGFGNNAGEVRFTFGWMDSTLCNPIQSDFSKGTAIFEYGIPITSCTQLVQYAKRWRALRDLVPGTPAYNNLLDSLTDVVTRANAAPAKPNGSALNQLRTNELMTTTLPWELREFKINATSKLLKQEPVALTPNRIFNRLANSANLPLGSQPPPGTATEWGQLTCWINANAASINAQTHVVPLTFGLGGAGSACAPPGAFFLGGKSHTDGIPANPMRHTWDGTLNAIPTKTRHLFALNTCDGCHGGEANTFVGNLVNPVPGQIHGNTSFVHINPTPCNVRPTLSAFLTGDPAQADKMFRVTDLVRAPKVWKFNDLLRRAKDLNNLINNGCGGRLSIVRDLSEVLLVPQFSFGH